MLPNSRPIGAVATAVLVVVLAGCSGAGTGVDAQARTIQVRMYDDMRYDPAAYEFLAGETVRFEVQNAGRVRHELFVGDVAAHEEHADEMRAADHGDDAHANPAAVRVEPGATAILEYTFDEPGDLMAACHEPGHYEACMVAPISVHPAP